MPDKPQKSDDAAYAVGAIALLAVLLSVPLVLSIAVWLTCSRFLAKRECWALIGLGAIAWALEGASFLSDYIAHIKELLARQPTFEGIPFMMLGATVALLVGIYGLVLSSRFGAKVPKRLQGSAPLQHRPKVTTIVPTAEDKSRLVPARPDGALLINKNAHAIQGGEEPGKRRFPIGIGVNGTAITLSEAEVRTHGVILGSTGSGKRLGLQTPIPTPSGWTTMGQLSVGDEVLSRDGLPCRVTRVSPVEELPDLYRVTFADGQTLEADFDHQWVVSSFTDRNYVRSQKRAAAIDMWNLRQQQIDSLMTLAFEVASEPRRVTSKELFEFVSSRITDLPWNGHRSMESSLRMTDCPTFDGYRTIARNYRSETVSCTYKVHASPTAASLLALAEKWETVKVPTAGTRAKAAAARKALVDVALLSDVMPHDELAELLRSHGATFRNDDTAHLAVRRFIREAGVRQLKVERAKEQATAGPTSGRNVVLYDLETACKSLAVRLSQQYGHQPTTEAGERVMTTGEILGEGLLTNGGQANFAVRIADPLDLPERRLPLDPYVLGAWLGDGTARQPVLAGIDPEIWERFESAGFKLRHNADGVTHYIYGLRGKLTAARVLANKHIPTQYLRSGHEQRLSLLQGIMDTDGTISTTGVCELSLSDRRLATDALELIRSLGIKASVSWDRPASYRNEDGDLVECKPRHRIKFTTTLPVFHLRRKAERLPTELRTTHQWNYITNIEKIDPVPARCIQVDSDDSTYLAGGFIPTHNTETIKALCGALLDLGWSGMVLDLKEDTAPGGLRDWCEIYARTHSLPYQELRLSDPDPKFWFNPLSGIGPDEIRDMILTLQEFDDAYWQAINKELLGQAVNLLVWAHEAAPDLFPEPTMFDLGKMLSTGSIKEATKKARAVVLQSVPGVTEEDFRTLANPTQAHQQSAGGFGAKLTLIYDTQAGRTTLREGDGTRRPLDVTAPGVVYVGLDSQGKADLTAVISSSILQRMSVYAAARTTGLVTGDESRKPRFLIVDEANWVNRTIVQNLLSRARSAGIAMFLCTQGPEDWIDKQGDDWGRLTQNTNVAIIMRQGSPKAAELCADYIGVHDVLKQSSSRRVTTNVFGKQKVVRDDNFRVMENQMEREMEEHIVSPEEVRQLTVGEGILKVGTTQRIEWVKVSQRDPAARVR